MLCPNWYPASRICRGCWCLWKVLAVWEGCASQGCSGTGRWALGAFLEKKGRENDAVTAGLQVISLTLNFTSAFLIFPLLWGSELSS